MSENNADVQGLREMLADYRIAYDDHPVGRRIALNVFIHSIRERAERAERILAALREPSEAVVEAACLAMFGANWACNDPRDVVWRAGTRQRFITQLSAAVAAAEKEVGRE